MEKDKQPIQILNEIILNAKTASSLGFKNLEMSAEEATAKASFEFWGYGGIQIGYRQIMRPYRFI